MSHGILFLVLSRASVAGVEGIVRELIVPDKRHTVQIISDAAAATLTTDVKSRMAKAFISRISGYPEHAENRLMIGRDVECSLEELTEWWDSRGYGLRDPKKYTPAAMRREVKEHLEKTGAHWRVHAEAELRAFDGPACNLAAWVQQFGELGCGDIGRKIAAKLRVIRTGNLPHGAFAMRANDMVGHRQASCYVQDDDTGGSWLEMQAILSKAWPPGSIFPVHWDKRAGTLTFPAVQVDEFVIHEDGLWSGSEAIRRLRAIAAAPPAAPVTFRFGVVTDFGLMAARQAIRSLGLSGRVSIDASCAELISFLQPEMPDALRIGSNIPPEAYFTDLHRHVAPFAFSVADDWTADEVGICEGIGGQLVARWLSQDPAKQPSAEKIARFALGGGRFASTVVFSRSVPKVCLPLLWLDGPVELNGTPLVWRPLFVDARRVSDPGLLLPPTMGRAA